MMARKSGRLSGKGALSEEDQELEQAPLQPEGEAAAEEQEEVAAEVQEAVGEGGGEGDMEHEKTGDDSGIDIENADQSVAGEAGQNGDPSQQGDGHGEPLAKQRKEDMHLCDSMPILEEDPRHRAGNEDMKRFLSEEDVDAEMEQAKEVEEEETAPPAKEGDETSKEDETVSTPVIVLDDSSDEKDKAKKEKDKEEDSEEASKSKEEENEKGGEKLPLLAVSGLSYKVRSSDLKKVFADHCTIVDIHIVHSSRNRPRAHITVSTPEEAAQCVNNLNKTVIQGRRVWVEEIKPIKRCRDDKEEESNTGEEGGEKTENGEGGEAGETENDAQKESGRNEEENDRYARKRRSGSRSRRRSRSRSRRYRRSPPEREYGSRRDMYRSRYDDRPRYQDRYRSRMRDDREDRDNRDARLRRRHEEEKLEIEEKRLERERAELLRLKAERTRIERQRIEMEKEMLLRDTRKLVEKRKVEVMDRPMDPSFMEYKMMRRDPESDPEQSRFRWKKRGSPRGHMDDEDDEDKRMNKNFGPKDSGMWVSGTNDHFMANKSPPNRMAAQQQSWPGMNNQRWPTMNEGMRMSRPPRANIPRHSNPRHMGAQNFIRPYGGARF